MRFFSTPTQPEQREAWGRRRQSSGSERMSFLRRKIQQKQKREMSFLSLSFFVPRSPSRDGSFSIDSTFWTLVQGRERQFFLKEEIHCTLQAKTCRSCSPLYYLRAKMDSPLPVTEEQNWEKGPLSSPGGAARRFQQGRSFKQPRRRLRENACGNWRTRKVVINLREASSPEVRKHLLEAWWGREGSAATSRQRMVNSIYI